MFEESFWGFVWGLIAEAEGAVVHGDHGGCAEFCECEESFFWVHVDVALAWGVVGSYG